MNKITKLTHLLLAVSLTLLFGCGGSGSSDVKAGQALLTCDVPQVSNAAGTQCVDPEPISCDAPLFPDANNESCTSGYNPDLPDPVVFAGEGEAILFYKRDKNEGYEGYRLHSWNTDGCDAYAPPFDATDWANGHEYNWSLIHI